jgi:putative cell wall-binding protein
MTGRVSLIEPGLPLANSRTTVIDGLPSYEEHFDDPDAPGPPEPEPFSFATGPHDVRADASGQAGYVLMGAHVQLADREAAAEAEEEPAINLFGTLLEADFVTGDFDVAADLVAYENAENPDGTPEEEWGLLSNPFALLMDGSDAIVADAAGNSLLRVPVTPGALTPIDAIDTIAAFPPNPQPFPPFIPGPPRGFILPGEPVPTSITMDGDGNYLVGELPGFPFVPGASRLWTVPADGVDAQPALFTDGFTTIIDIERGPDGNLYVLELANDGLLAAEATGEFRGALVRYVAATGAREVLLTEPLTAPGGMTFIGTEGDLLVTNCSVCFDEGQVLRLSNVLDAEPILATRPATASTDENQPVVIDVGPRITGDDVEVREVTLPGNGAVVADGTTILYQPAAHFSGQDRIHYQACNDDGCVIGIVTIDVRDLPTGRFDGATRVETAVRVARGHFPGGADHVVVTRSDRYPDALAGGVLAATVNAPILLTPSDALHPAVIEEINRLGATTAYVLGGDAAVSEAVEEAIVDETSVEDTVRVSGPDRFGTAAAIRDEIAEVTGEDADGVYVAEGLHADELRGWPDVLSASALAAHEGRPILLVMRDLLPPATTASLEDGVAEATIVGGTAAVSAAVAAQIDGIVDDVDRVGGRTRYETSAALAERARAAGMDEGLLYIATGRNWPDALAAGPAVALAGGVLLLSDPLSLDNSPPVRTFLRAHRPFDSVNLLGGTAALSAAIEAQIRAELE